MKPKAGPAFYRSQAEELRAIAARDIVRKHIKQELVKIALQYERLTAHGREQADRCLRVATITGEGS